MDERDQRLLDELQSQGFQKSAVLAPRFGVGERTIRRRISIMKSKGIIKIVALPNPILSGYKAWAKIGIKVELKYLRYVARKLVEHPEVSFGEHEIGKLGRGSAAGHKSGKGSARQRDRRGLDAQ